MQSKTKDDEPAARYTLCRKVVPLEAYPNTLRRLIFDQAGKIVRHSGRIALKVTQALSEVEGWVSLSTAGLSRLDDANSPVGLGGRTDGATT